MFKSLFTYRNPTPFDPFFFVTAHFPIAQYAHGRAPIGPNGLDAPYGNPTDTAGTRAGGAAPGSALTITQLVRTLIRARAPQAR